MLWVRAQSRQMPLTTTPSTPPNMRCTIYSATNLQCHLPCPLASVSEPSSLHCRSQRFCWGRQDHRPLGRRQHQYLGLHVLIYFSSLDHDDVWIPDVWRRYMWFCAQHRLPALLSMDGIKRILSFLPEPQCEGSYQSRSLPLVFCRRSLATCYACTVQHAKLHVHANVLRPH